MRAICFDSSTANYWQKNTWGKAGGNCFGYSELAEERRVYGGVPFLQPWMLPNISKSLKHQVHGKQNELQTAALFLIKILNNDMHTQAQK